MKQLYRQLNNKDINTRGVTLVEVLLYISVVAVVLTAISALYAALLQSRVKNTTVLEVERQGVFVMQTVTQAIRNASDINIPDPGANSSLLSINDPNNDTASVFSISDEAVQVERAGGEPMRLTNNRVLVDELSFQNLARDGTADIIRATLTLTHRNPEGRNEYSFEKTFQTSATVRQP